MPINKLGFMDTDTPTETAPPRRRNIFATLKGLFFTLMVLAALWFALRYVLTPLVLPKNAPETAAVSSNVEGRIQALEEKLAALESKAAPDLAPLEARVAALENAPKAAAEAAPAARSEEMEALRTEVEKLKTGHSNVVKTLILTGQLQDAIRSGRPFASELTALVTLKAALKETLSPLSSASFTGVATLDQLKEQFAHAIAPALAPDNGEKSLAQNLRSLVKIRKVGEAQKGKDDEAIIARAEAKLAKGDVAGALQETESLSPRAMKDFAAWQDRAGMYLAAQAALAALSLRLEGEE